MILLYYKLLGKKEVREGEGKEGGKRLHTVQFLLKDYSYHNCDIVCILHSVTEEGDAEAPNKQLVSSKESPGLLVSLCFLPTSWIPFLVIRLPHTHIGMAVEAPK